MKQKGIESITEVLDRSTVLSIALISLLASLLTLSIPIAAQTLINIIAFGKLFQPVVTLSLIVLILMFALGALGIWQTVIIEVIQQKLMVNISLKLTRQFTHLSLQNFSIHHGPELVNRFFEVVTIKKSIANLLLYGMNLGLQLIFGLLLLVLYHPLFLAFDAFILLSLTLIIFLPYRKGLSSAIQECEEKHHLGAWLEELLINRFLFRFNHYDAYALQKSDKHLVSFLKARNRHFRQLIKHQIGFYTLSAVASSLLLGLGGYLVIHNQLSLGQLVAAEIILGALIYAFKRFSSLLENYYDLRASKAEIDSVLELNVEDVNTDLNALFFPLKDLKIRLPNQDEVRVTAQSALTVFAHQTGRCKLFAETLMGFADHLDMEVLVNQSLCNGAHRIALRHQTLVLRKFDWFAGTVLENLVLNNKKAVIKGIRGWLNQFGLEDKIMRLPQGLDTLIFDWQTVFTEFELIQLMVIRALLLKPQLLIIDRLFDGLEQESIDHLLKALMSMKNTLVILLTQEEAVQPFTNRLVLK